MANRRFPLTALLAASLALLLPLQAAVPFEQAERDLRPDPAARFGTLPNGLRYVVMPNREPKGRVSLRLLVLAGSFDETEAQRGLAHFLEHMAFNGSTHYAPGTLVEKLQRMGMGFGADTNASTSFERTLFQLELPDNAPATLAEGLQILEDYGGGLLLEDKMVDKERGIILSEQRTRDSVGYRTMVAQLGFMEAGTRVPERLPIGLTDVIQKSDRAPFVDFYNMWYRPGNLVVIVVGDIDGPAVEKEIVDGFSSLAPRSPEPPPVDLGKVADFAGIKALYHSEPEAPDTQIVIASVVPYTHEPDTAAARIKYLPRSLAVDMLNQRFEILSKKEHAQFIKAEASVQEAFNLYREAEVAVTCRPEQWNAALGVADGELRRALEYGFRPDELKEAVASFRNNVEQAVKTAATRRSDELSDDLAESLVEREVFTSPAGDLALFGPALDKVTADDCRDALRAAWASRGRYVFVAGNVKFTGVGDAIVAKAFDSAEAMPVKPTDASPEVSWAYADFGAPGRVESRKHVDDLDITEVVFANGVRLNLKKTDFEANTIHVAARLGTGQLTEPAATKPGLSTYSSLTFVAGGLGKHSADDLERIFAGKTVGLEFASTPDSFALVGQTNNEDLALELQLLTASIEDPGYRVEAARIARKKIEQAYLSYAHTDHGPLVLEVPKLLSSGDPRFGLPPKAQMLARNLDEEKEWLSPQLASGALEVSVAGDIDIEAVISAAAKTLGTMPKRDPRPSLDDRKKVVFPQQPFAKDFGIESQIQKARIAVYWPTADGMEIRRARRLSMLGEVLADRLRVKVREELGSTYSPTVFSAASDVFPGYGYLTASVVVDPAKAVQIVDVVIAVATDMSEHGITADELERAKNPTLTSIRETERTNGYWMTVLGRAQEKPEVLDWARSRQADFAAITIGDISGLARAYLAPTRSSRVIIHPYLMMGTGPLKSVPAPPDG